MKNVFFRTGMAVMIAFLVACSGGNSPKGVAENFLNAMNKLDFEGAKKYGTEDTGKLLDMMGGFLKMMPDSAKNKSVKVEMLTEKIDGDKATVTYKEEGKGEETMELVKKDGVWKVAMSKDNLGGGNSSGMESGATTTDTTSSSAVTADPVDTATK